MQSIVLAHEKSFEIGPLTVEPATRSVRRGARSEILEPRVMQVLVALGRHPCAVVTRDDLVSSCWEGRIVGDDAVNRVIGRLRRTAEGIGAGVFTVETITRVGYRLSLLQTGSGAQERALRRSDNSKLTRRNLVLVGGAAAAAIAGGKVILDRRKAEPQLSPAAKALLQQAQVAQWQNTREGQNQAIGLYRRIVASEPRFADGWGYLAMAYAWTSHYRQSAEASMLEDRARSAAQQAFALEPGNALALAGAATARPFMGNWLPIGQALRAALRRAPSIQDLEFSLGLFLCRLGYAREALGYMSDGNGSTPTPAVYFSRAQMLWSAERFDELDKLLAEARNVYPTHFALWFAQFYALLFGGRPREAAAMIADEPNLPTGIAAEEIASVQRVAELMISPTPEGIDRIAEEWLARAHKGAGHAENAVQVLAAFGRIDEAFGVLRAYFFSEGFDCGEVRFNLEQGTYTPHNDRLTAFLFMPPLARLRRDARFGRIVDRIGIGNYWRTVGRAPDYLASRP